MTVFPMRLAADDGEALVPVDETGQAGNPVDPCVGAGLDAFHLGKGLEIDETGPRVLIHRKVPDAQGGDVR